MIRTVACSACSATFPVDSRKVPEEGVYARCSVCEEVFFVAPGGEEETAATAPPSPQTLPEPATADKIEPEPATADQVEPEQVEQDQVEAAQDAEAPSAEPTEEDFVLETGGTELGTLEGLDASPAIADEDTTDDVSGLEDTEAWVFETEPVVDESDVAVERLDTVEEGLRRAQDEDGAEPSAPANEPAAAYPPPPPATVEPEPAAETPEPTPFSGPSAQTEEPREEAPPTPVQGFSFGRRDPHEKASRLARVLVSDIITYNPERHQRALDGGTLEQDFEGEIQKSWSEYVDQVGKELAESTDYFTSALNEILARGRQVF